MVINTSLLFSWLFHILHLLFFSCSLECPSPECPSCSVLVWASVTRCCTGPSEVELVLQLARAMQCSRRRLRGGGGRGRAPSLWACRARSVFKACKLPGSPWTRASRRHHCHTWSRHMRTFLHPLAGADLVPRQVVQVQAQLLCLPRTRDFWKYNNWASIFSQWYW